MAFEFMLQVRDVTQGQAVTWAPDRRAGDELPEELRTVHYRCGHCGIIFGASPQLRVDGNTVIRCQNCGSYNSL